MVACGKCLEGYWNFTTGVYAEVELERFEWKYGGISKKSTSAAMSRVVGFFTP